MLLINIYYNKPTENYSLIKILKTFFLTLVTINLFSKIQVWIFIFNIKNYTLVLVRSLSKFFLQL